MNASETSGCDPVAVPVAPEAVWVERLLWLFLAAFALDYRADMARQGSGGAGLDQLLFLGAAGFSTAGIAWLGRRHLLVRPGAWFLILWSGFLVFLLGNALLQGVAPGRSLRIILPFGLCLAGMMNAHVAGCLGLRPSRIVAPVFAAACVNVVWRIVHGFLFKEISVETVRVEVQSPANNWIAAWIGCTLLLRPRFHWTLPLACAVLFTGIFITVTRSLLFPVMASALASFVCFALSCRWGVQSAAELPRRMLPVGLAVSLVLGCIGIAAVSQPALLERWNERLFHHAADRNTTADISYLTRRAEADAIWKILDENPIRFIHGKGIGASYYWDPAYMPEIHLVFPPDLEVGHDVWFAGHSTWTYALFSGGAIGLLAHIALIVGVMAASLHAARSNATHPGPDQWLAFLPFVAACCLLSETLTSNPFDERLAGIIFGMMAGLPQSFLVRASWIHAGLRRQA